MILICLFWPPVPLSPHWAPRMGISAITYCTFLSANGTGLPGDQPWELRSDIFGHVGFFPLAFSTSPTPCPFQAHMNSDPN